ncbi:hypothetical protein [Clostridium sp. UBA4548]|uniref:hypothetical protein n=1 Tax=Clostridium sp. UBA4548 TaxID=1946361 RepID=UPI0025C25C0A|nr:hypothetical protein [Clostridium sp. UBA4548]
MSWVNINEYIQRMESYHVEWEKKNNSSHLRFNNIEVFKKWCKENNIEKWFSGSSNWTSLVGNLARWNPNVEVPYQDHKALFKNDKNENILIIQPYYRNVENIKNWAIKRGIKVEEKYDFSWHCPNQTTLIEFRIENKEWFRKAVKEIVDLSR